MHKLTALMVLGLLIASGPTPAAAAGDIVDLQAIIDDAAPGSVVVLQSGTYAGGVTIDKPLTIRGNDRPIVDGGETGTVIEVTAPDVTIEGIVVANSGASLDHEDAGIKVRAPRVTIRDNRLVNVLFGMYLLGAEDSRLVDNVVGAKDLFIANRGDGIRLWESERSIVAGNVVRGGRDAVFWFTDEVVVRDNEISGGRYGLHFMYSDGVLIERNILNENSVGVFMMYSSDITISDNVMAENGGPSGQGLSIKDLDDYTIVGNRFIANRAGLYLDNSPSSFDARGSIRDNLFAYNQVGILFLPAVRRNDIYENTFIDNVKQVGITTTGTFKGNNWSKDGRGNYWSDFAGYDADGNGIGDVSYRVDDLYNTLTDKYPDLVFYQETPAARVISLAAEMFPILRPRPLVEDEFPLIERPALPPAPRVGTPPGSSPLLLISILMVAGAVAVVLIPSRRRRPHLGREVTA